MARPDDPVKARMLGMAQCMTQPFTDKHDEALFGLQAKAGPPGTAPGKVLLGTILELPKHFIVQLIRTVMPLIALLGAMALGGVALRSIKEAAVSQIGSGIEMYATIRWHTARSPPHWALAALMIHASAFGWAVLFILPLACMWNPKVTHPWLMYSLIANAATQLVILISTLCTYLSFGDDFEPDSAWPMGVWWLNFVLLVSAMYTPQLLVSIWRALAAVRNHEWCWIYTVYCMSMLTFGEILVFVIRFLMGLDDMMKLGFVILVNAPLMEALSVISRFSARSTRHNHPSTSWIIISMGVVFKKSWMRFVVGTMKSTAVVTLASILTGILEILGRVTMPKRDKWTYTKLFSTYLPPDANPLALMTNARSRTLRAETESLEGITDMSFIIMGVTWPYMYGASLNGQTLPELKSLVIKAIIQWGMESALDVIICIYLAVVQNYHILLHGKSKCSGWSCVVAAVVFTTTILLAIHTFAYVLCAAPPGVPDGVEWVFCAMRE